MAAASSVPEAPRFVTAEWRVSWHRANRVGGRDIRRVAATGRRAHEQAEGRDGTRAAVLDDAAARLGTILACNSARCPGTRDNLARLALTLHAMLPYG